MMTLRDPEWLVPVLARAGITGCLVDAATGAWVEGCDALSRTLGQPLETIQRAHISETLGIPFERLHAAAQAPVALPGIRYPSTDVLCHRVAENVLLVLIRDRALELEWKRRAEEGAMQQRLFNALLDLVPDMVFLKEAEHLRYVRMNGAGLEVLGHAPGTLVGKTDWDFFPRQAEIYRATDAEALATRHAVHIPTQPVETPRGLRIYSTRKVPIFDEGGAPRFVLGLAEDVTEKVVAESERDSAQRDVRNLEKERSVRERFIATLSHDLRNPLAAVRAMVELIPRHIGEVDTVRRSCQRVVETLDRVDRMIVDFLDASRIKAGEPLTLQIEQIDLVRLVEDTLSDLALVHGGRLRFSTNVEKLVGYWSPEKLRRAIENLVSNGLKYGQPDGEVTVALRALGARTQLEVHNLGPALSVEEQRRLFTPFSRTHTGRESGKSGWGLGLTLVRGIATAHGGTVSVESSPEQGTRFTLELPLDSRGAPGSTFAERDDGDGPHPP